MVGVLEMFIFFSVINNKFGKSERKNSCISTDIIRNDEIYLLMEDYAISSYLKSTRKK